MTVVHVDFVQGRTVSSPLNYSIAWQTGETAPCFPDEQSAWRSIGKRWEVVQERLTFKQYQRVTTKNGRAVNAYRTLFERTLKVSKNASVVRLCHEALKAIDAIENQFSTSAKAAQEACQ